jgi:RNA exonuclease 4
MARCGVFNWLIQQVTQVLCISHPTVNTRDVAAFVQFRRGLGCGAATPPLHVLVHRLMGRSMGLGYEHPVRPVHLISSTFNSLGEL